MSLSSLIQKGLYELGEKGLLVAAQRVQPGVQSIDDLTTETLEKLLARKPGMTRPADISEISVEEAQSFGKALEGGSDVAPQFRETAPDLMDAIPASPGGKPLAPATGSVSPKNPMQNTNLADQIKNKELNKGLKQAGAVAGITGAGALGGYGLTGSWDEPPLVETRNVTLGGEEGTKGDGAPATSSAPKVSPKIMTAAKRIADLSLEKPELDTVDYEKALGEAAAKEQLASDEYRAAKKQQGWAQIAERIGKALVQYGAARQGLRDNVDLSNVSTPGTDWAAMLAGEQDLRDEAFRRSAKTREDATRLQEMRARALGEKTDISNREKTLEWQEANARDRQEMDAQQRMAELEARKATEPSEEDKFDQRLKQEEALLQLRQKYRGDKSPEADKRRAALGELQAAILTKDDKKVDSAFIKAGEFLTPEELEKIGSAGRGWIGPSKKEVVKELLGGEGAPASQNTKEAAQTTDPRISSYAANNNLSYQDARRILVNRGYTPNE
jgi:hypothetical protein